MLFPAVAAAAASRPCEPEGFSQSFTGPESMTCQPEPLCWDKVWNPNMHFPFFPFQMEPAGWLGKTLEDVLNEYLLPRLQSIRKQQPPKVLFCTAEKRSQLGFPPILDAQRWRCILSWFWTKWLLWTWWSHVWRSSNCRERFFSVTLAGMYIGALHATCVNTLQIGRTPFVNPTHHREYESFWIIVVH